MRPSGVIYQKGKSYKWYGETVIYLDKKTRAIYGFFQGIGVGLIGLCLISFIILFFHLIKEEIRYRFSTKHVDANPNIQVKAAVDENNKEILVKSEADQLGISSDFSIYIPKIDARSNVIASVNPFSKKEYLEALARGVAHASTTYFPGQGKPVFLFSHSTDSPANFIRYNAVFYLLKKLDINDEIVIYFYGEKHVYLVERAFVVSSKDTSWLSGEGDEEKLILMTCDPPGTTLKRFIVIAKKAI
ncbi:MAG: sortase [Patescibacteria group bacterium]|nr:sortase [Patescibacteria group bacterium]